MAQNQNQPGSSNDTYFMAILLILVVAYVFLSYHYEYIASVWKAIRTVEVCSLSWIPHWMPMFGKLKMDSACQFLTTTDSMHLSKGLINQFDRVYAPYFSWIPAVVLIALGVNWIRKNEGVAPKFDKETMLNYYEKWFPDILSGVIKDSPLNHPLEYDRDLPDTGKYGKSMSPEQFATLNPPLALEEEAKTDSSFCSPIWDGELDFDEDLAERSLSKQLGERYLGRMALNDVQKKVISIIHSKIPTSEKDRFVFLKDCLISLVEEYEGKKESRFNVILYPIFPALKAHVLGCIKNQGKKGKKDKKVEIGKDEILSRLKFTLKDKRAFIAMDDKKNKGYLSNCAMFKLERRLAQHAFVNSGMMSLLVEAREAGRVDSFANFNWVKEHDRTLWYCLDNVGRNVSFIECAGVFSHWTIEKIVGQPITHPEVTGAVEGLKKYLIQVSED
jgi:hypothetical protein